MKNLFTLLITLLFFGNIVAQVSNDECAGAINLGIAPVCSQNIYSNENATASDIGENNKPDCFQDIPQQDVWFTFTTGSENTNYQITIKSTDANGNPIEGISAAVYRGFCPDNIFALNACATTEFGGSELSFEISDLAPNDLYYIRIENIGGGAQQGDFSICIQEQNDAYTMSDSFSSECSGVLYDSGGPNGDYSGNEDLVFTICPEVANQCIAFNLEYYNIEQAVGGGIGDVLTFYNGDNIQADQILQISGSDIAGVKGNGGVCRTIYADECLTIRMTSDNEVNFEGFKASWECSLSECPVIESIVIDTAATSSDLEEALSSSLVDIKITNLDCPRGAFGTFTDGPSGDLGLNNGILLTSGKANIALGPNQMAGSGFAHINTEGDPDLDELSSIIGSNLLSLDACVIELEAVAKSDQLSFQFIFGSEEYPEYENSTFDDIFALFIEGPGIQGNSQLGNKLNLAVLPNSETPIQVSSVNSENNWEYFRNNQKGLSSEYDGLVIDYLGGKKSLTASASVIPCETYKLKFAIADRNDFIFDSGVFISELTNAVPEISMASSSGVSYLLEECTDGQELLVFQLPAPSENELKFTVEISGTATDGADANLNLPDTITFAPNQQILTFPIEVLADNITEGEETFIITLKSDIGCDIIEVTTFELIIKEALEVQILDGLDTIYVCQGVDFELEATGALNYTWTPADNLSDPNISNPIFINPQETTVISVTGTLDINNDPTCSDTKSVTIIPIDPEIEIVTDDELTICFGEEINVEVLNNTNGQGITWLNPESGILDPNSAITTIRPTKSDTVNQEFIVQLSSGGCTLYDTISIYVDPFELPEIIAEEREYCQNDLIQLANESTQPLTHYQWSPSDFLNSDTIANAIATATRDITYKLVATSFRGVCKDSSEISFTVKENNVEIIPEMDTILLCLGDSIFLDAMSTSNGQGINWTGITSEDPGASTVYVKPEVSGYTIVNLNFEGCSHADSVWIQVDSLPDLSYEIIQDKEEYCPGEVVTIVSPGYNETHFPNISFSWDSSPGIQSDLENMNMAFVATESTTFRRITTNGGCVDTLEKEIVVIDPSIEIMLSDTSVLCPFTPVQLTIETESELDEIMWDPTEGLSCEDCPSPTASVGETTVFSVSAQADGCPASASVEVRVIDPNLFITFDNANPCPGQPVQLGFSVDGEVDEINWSPNRVLSCDNCPDPIATVDETTEIGLTVTINGCQFSVSRQLTVNSSIRAIPIGVEPNDSVGVGDDIIITTGTQPTFGPNTTYEWNVDGSGINVDGPVLNTTQDKEGETNYDVLITDDEGCFWGASITVVGLIPEFDIPNAFTPNNDDINDVFRLINTAGGDLNNWDVNFFRIYNRWGQLIFSCDTRECALISGWDGTYNGRQAPQDTYIYAISIILDNGETLNFRGEVTLLRG